MLNGNYVILSIDFDYFVNADYDARTLNFPDGNETLPPNLQKFIWDRYYPDIQKIGIKKYDLERLIDFSKGSPAFKNKNIYSFESHKEIYPIIKKEGCENYHIFNIDFHHDMYNVLHDIGSRVDCGNWGSVLKEEYPNLKLSWIACDDSDKSALGMEEVDCYEIIDLYTFLDNTPEECVDMIFMCRSDMWTPPHLDKWYNTLETELLKKPVLPIREVL